MWQSSWEKYCSWNSYVMMGGSRKSKRSHIYWVICIILWTAISQVTSVKGKVFLIVPDFTLTVPNLSILFNRSRRGAQHQWQIYKFSEKSFIRSQIFRGLILTYQHSATLWTPSLALLMVKYLYPIHSSISEHITKRVSVIQWKSMHLPPRHLDLDQNKEKNLEVFPGVELWVTLGEFWVYFTLIAISSFMIKF